MTLTPLPYQQPSLSNRDIENLNIMAILHYVWGGIVMFFSSIGLVYVFLGLFMVKSGPAFFAPPGGGAAPPGAPPAAIGWIFVAIGGGMVLLGWTIGGLNLYSARCMQTRKHRLFSLIMAGINCMSVPFGTALGVFTFIILLRESVTHLYATRG